MQTIAHRMWMTKSTIHIVDLWDVKVFYLNRFSFFRARIRQCRYSGWRRDANNTQIKHHWWWKLNRVFDELRITRDHTGPVLLLEEDNYVAEDALHILRVLQTRATTSCPKCEFFALGVHLNQKFVYRAARHDHVSYSYLL